MKNFCLIRNSILIICLIFFAYIAGCFNPLVANTIHKKIKVGMRVEDVVNIIAKYQGRHLYLIKLANEKAETMCTPDEFVKIVTNVSNKKVTYTNYQAKIVVYLMGPVFTHNTFDIEFDTAGKVKSVTKVEHWD